jgi:hypothetical protein
MPPAYIQSNGVDGSSSVTFSSAVAAGNTLVYIIRIGSSTVTAFQASDTVNGSTGWTSQQVVETIDGHTLAMAYRQNTAAGTPTVSASWTGGGSVRTAIAEYGGLATSSFDQWAIVDRLNQPTVVVSPSITTTAASEVLVAAASCGDNPTESSNGAGANPSSGWTNRQNVGGGKLFVDDVVVSATGTYQAAWSLNDNVASGIMSFKAPAGGGPATFGGTLSLMGVG